MNNLGMAYSIKNRSKKMAGGGMAHCAHGGPAHCAQGCYDKGGDVDTVNEKLHPEHQPKKMAMGGSVEHPDSETPRESDQDARAYEMGRDEPEDEAADMPRAEMTNSMNSEASEKEGDMEDADEPMKMAKGGMFHAKNMAKSIMMAMGGMINSAKAEQAGEEKGIPSVSSAAGNEDIDIFQTTPHDDNLSDEGEYPLMEEEGYEEGHQAKMRRKGGLLERVMSKIHAR